MSEEIAQRLQGTYAAYSRRDRDGFVAEVDPDYERMSWRRARRFAGVPM